MMFCCTPSARAAGYIHFFTVGSEAGLEGIPRAAIIKAGLASIIVTSIASHKPTRSAIVIVPVSLYQLHGSGEFDRCSRAALIVLPRPPADPWGNDE